MSPTLNMVNQQLARFKSGELGLADMWSNIESSLTSNRRGEEAVDPYEDDKAERRIISARTRQSV